MLKTLIIVIAVVLVAGLGWYLVINRPSAEKNTQVITQATPTPIVLPTPSPSATPITAVFTNNQAKTSVTVVFDQATQKATLTGAGFTNEVLTQAQSASGARYVNDDESLELWNKGDTVTLSKNGKVVFAGTAASETGETSDAANALTGVTWVWQNTKMNDGKIFTPNKPEAFTLVFAKTNTVSGTTDCNSFSGSYETGDNSSLTFGPLASTMMFCEGSQETEFLSRLQNIASYMYSPTGDLILLIKFDSGSMTFIKK